MASQAPAERRKVRALAATLGYIEAKITIDERKPGRTAETARFTYTALADAFPEISHLVDSKYFTEDRRRPQLDAVRPLEPPC